ncbi:killer cell lectin-like receptor 2 [Peromyscus leucopus]|uniref:killer cell lectin-like receptor 2 n=1 Tax=Peromyscus leucopus TaxID=10041 RepID=UPI001885525B|nr:killer cell lectin-like receptor 2 [Peromyscus leucopus]XP_037059956.1 killer cell lectin-like receptor 2 [Peromyscus leucopus]
MGDEEITYTTVRFHKSSGLQNRGRADEKQGPREAGHRESSVPWCFIVIPLGVLCSILLVTIAVLVTYIFQYSQENHELQKNLNNPSQRNTTMQNNSCLNETLRNKSTWCDDFKHQKEPGTLNRKQNRCCGKTKVVLECVQHTEKHVEGHLFCCGIKCYYFIMDMDHKHWSGCKQTCQDCSLSLLKIDDDDEPKFLQSQVTANRYWIGLKYSGSKGEWQWIGDVPSELNLTTVKLLKESGGCAFLSFGGIREDDCGRKYPCICEKRMDKFPGSMYSMKEK